MFYDLDAPIEFAKAVQRLLAPDGIWVVEMSYLPLMLAQNSFDTICHEHLEYYSLAVLEYIFAKANLRVFKAELNDINGGSIRCFVCHAGNDKVDVPGATDFLRWLRLREFEMELDTNKPYETFQQRIDLLRTETRSLLQELRVQGKRIHIYGASTKGNVILQWYGIDRMIVEVAADRNPEKAGARTLGTDIPIVDEPTSRDMRPDYYLVLPWHFKREFLERERALIESGTGMIFPLPELSVIDAENIDAELAKLEQRQFGDETYLDRCFSVLT
jgi:NDP-4-keto-2,6-dideoxyhexose 3-C-methyltransferase